MKYLNSVVFLGLMILVAGCQKKEQPQEPKKASHHTSAHDAKAMKAKKTGPTVLETKKSAAAKKNSQKSTEKDDHKKLAAPKKDIKKSVDNKNKNKKS